MVIKLQNGFKCHTASEAHQRQLLLFGDSPNKFLSDFSRDFETGFMDILRRQYGEFGWSGVIQREGETVASTMIQA